MSKALIITLVGATLLALTLSIAYAKHPGMGGGWAGGPGPMGRMAEHLDLEDEQRDAIRDIMRTSRADARELREQMGQLRRDIADTIRTSGFDKDQVRLMLENRSSLMIDVAMLRIESMASVYQTLTPEQQAKVDEFMAQGPRGWHGKRGGRWHNEGSDLPPADL